MFRHFCRKIWEFLPIFILLSCFECYICMRTYCIQIVFELLEPLPLQSKYNRGCLSPISDMHFQMLAIWAAQGSTKKKKIGPIMSNFWGRFFHIFLGKKNRKKIIQKYWYNASPRRGLALSMQIVNFLIEFLWALYCFLDFTERDLHW